MSEDRFEYEGQALTVSELHKLARNGISRSGLRKRLRSGMSAADAMTRPVLALAESIRYARRKSHIKNPYQ